MRRVMYLWLPRWPIDRRYLSRRKNSAAPVEEVPLATVADAAGRRLLAAVNPAAASAGLAPGMPLADALSFLPGLSTVAAEPAEDAAALQTCGMVQPLQPVDRTRRSGRGADRDHRLVPSLGRGDSTCRRSRGPARSSAYRRAHCNRRHTRGRLGDGPLC